MTGFEEDLGKFEMVFSMMYLKEVEVTLKILPVTILMSVNLEIARQNQLERNSN